MNLIHIRIIEFSESFDCCEVKIFVLSPGCSTSYCCLITEYFHFYFRINRLLDCNSHTQTHIGRLARSEAHTHTLAHRLTQFFIRLYTESIRRSMNA